jgi:O-antigen/teichoic acid export membrane protein
MRDVIRAVSLPPMQQDESPGDSLRGRVFSGMAWSLLQTAGSRVLSMVILLILARLLGPKAFGIVTIAFVVLGVMTSVVDLGVADVLVRRLPQDQTDYDSAFWVAIGFSLLLATVTAASAEGLAKALNQPQLPPLLWILAATIPLSAIESIQVARMRAEMSFKRLALRTIAATTLGGVVGITMAFGGAGYWSLLVKGMVESGVSVLLLWATCSYRPGRQFSWQRWRELFSSARHLLGGRVLDIVIHRYDSFLISARLGPAELGLYSAGHRLYAAVLETLFSTANRVTLPVFARMRDDRERIQRSLLRLVRVTSFFTFPVFAAVGVLADPLIETLLGVAWRGAAPVISALSVGGLLFSVSYFNAPLLNATGRTELLFRLMLANAAMVLVAVSIGSLWGIVGVALGFALRGYVMLPLNLSYLRQAIGLSPRVWLATIAPAALATAVSSAALMGIQWLLQSLPAPARLLALAAVFPILHAAVCTLLIPGRVAAVLDELSAVQPRLGRLSRIMRRWQSILHRH